MSFELGDCTDGELAALAIAGRQTAYSELMKRHREAVFRVARLHTADDDTAVDITQQTFIAAFAAIARFDVSRPFRHWVLRIALNKCRDEARRRKVRALFAFAVPLESAADPADPHVNIERDVASREELLRTLNAMKALPVRLREVLLLRTVEGASQSETAGILGVTEKAVETRLRRARNKLQEILRSTER